MPHRYHPDDEQWIHQKLSPIQPEVRYNVCEAYTKVFNEAFDAEPLPHRKTGKARSAANTRLLTYFNKKYGNVFNK